MDVTRRTLFPEENGRRPLDQTPLHRSQWTICANAHHRLTSISLSFGGLRIILYHVIIISTIVSMGTLHPVRLSYVVSASRFTPPLLLSPTSDSPVHVLFHMMTMIGPQRYPYDKGRVQKPQSRNNSVLFTFSVMSASVTVIFGRKIAFLVKSFLSYVRYKGRGTSLMECLLFHFGNDATSHQSSSWMLICVFKTVDVWSISAFSLSQPRVPLKNQLEPPLRLITAQSPPMNGEIVVWRDNKYDSLPILLTFPLKIRARINLCNL